MRRQTMTRRRWAGAIALGAASALALGLMILSAVGATAVSTPPSPLSDAERLSAWVEGRDAQWEYVEQQFDDATRPDIASVSVVPDDQWDELTAGCFADRGLEVEVIEGGGYSYEGDYIGEEGEQFAVAQYFCSSTIVAATSLDLLLSPEERLALYNYYVGELIPCLGLAGVAPSAAPTQGDFVDEVGDARYWTPYISVYNSAPSYRVQNWLPTVCPQKPDWLMAKAG